MLFRVLISSKVSKWYIQVNHFPYYWETLKDENGIKYFERVHDAYGWAFNVGLEARYQDLDALSNAYPDMLDTNARLASVKNALSDLSNS